MSGRATARALAALTLVLAGCGVGDPLRLDQPIFVHGAVFREGALPGTPPLADGETPPEGVPLVTALETASGILVAGQLDRHFTGRTSADAYAIAVRIDGAGTGYYTLPVGATDPAFAGERDFDVELDVGSILASGLTHLSVVALDEAGRAGPRRDVEVCVVDGAIPNELSACDPSIMPPAAAIVLSWDTSADVDLVVTTPDGKRVDARHPTTIDADGGTIPAAALADPTVGRFVRDSNAACDADGRNQEVLVWQEEPTGAGAFLVGVDLFAACGTPGAHFEASIFRRRMRDDGTAELALVERREGQVLALAADEGRLPPLYVTYVSF